MENDSRAPPLLPAAAVQSSATATGTGSRHQRLLSGARIIKSYVHESDLRREASRCVNSSRHDIDVGCMKPYLILWWLHDLICRFNNTPVSLYAKPQSVIERSEYDHDEREQQQAMCGWEQDTRRLPAKPSSAPESQSYRLHQHGVVNTRSNNQREEEQETCGEQRAATALTSSTTTAIQQPLAAFFAGKTAHRARRLSISAAHAAQVHANANNNNNGSINPSAPGTGNPVKSVVIAKRKLQMESMVAHPYRTTTNAILAVPGRGKNNNVRHIVLL